MSTTWLAIPLPLQGHNGAADRRRVLAVAENHVHNNRPLPGSKLKICSHGGHDFSAVVPQGYENSSQESPAPLRTRRYMLGGFVVGLWAFGLLQVFWHFLSLIINATFPTWGVVGLLQVFWHFLSLIINATFPTWTENKSKIHRRRVAPYLESNEETKST